MFVTMAAPMKRIILLPILFFLFSFTHTPAKQGGLKLYTGWYYVVESPKGLMVEKRSGDEYFVNPKPILNEKNFLAIEVFEDTVKGNVIAGLLIKFDKQGAKAFSKATKTALGKKLAFLLCSRVLIAPIVQSQITSGKTQMYLADYTRKDLEKLKQALRR